MTNDTICAVSTPPGCGGIAVIRISGPEAIAIADTLWRGRPLAEAASHTARLGNIVDPADGAMLDQAVATVFRAPASFTGEDVVELAVHGSVYVQQALLALLCRGGARLAEPGEFTRRAFAAGKMDLAQAEAVADVVASESAAAHRLAVEQMRGGFSQRLSDLRSRLLELASLLELELDFSEEDVEFADRTRLTSLAREVKDEVDRLHSSFALGNAIKNGIPVAIVGAPNVGKSSILNMLVGDRRAIVSDIPGTTRDTIEDTAVIDGITFRFIDTAGLRTTSDPIEQQGVERALQTLRRARIILSVSAPTPTIPTASETTDPTDTDLISRSLPPNATIIHILNKSDLLPAPYSPQSTPSDPSPSASSQSPSPGLSPSMIPSPSTPLHLSTLTGEGADALRSALVSASGARETTSGAILVTNARHAAALSDASASLASFLEALASGLPTDLAAQDLRQALHHLGTITGAITTPDILSTIFTRFCIGK